VTVSRSQPAVLPIRYLSVVLFFVFFACIMTVSVCASCMYCVVLVLINDDDVQLYEFCRLAAGLQFPNVSSCIVLSYFLYKCLKSLVFIL